MQLSKVKINGLFSLDDRNMEQKKEILSKIRRSRKGTIFTPDSFLPTDLRYSSNILSELTAKGKLLKIAHGIYLKPITTRFGPIFPPLMNIAKNIAKRDGAKILPSGATAENFLGFSTQLPMNSVFLTSGTPRKLKIGNRTLTLKHSVPKTFNYHGDIMPILVLALKSIGKRNIDEIKLCKVTEILIKYPEEETWQHDIRMAPQWIRDIINYTKAKIDTQNEQMD